MTVIDRERADSADFLSQEQKRDVIYNNAAWFLRLGEEEIASPRVVSGPRRHRRDEKLYDYAGHSRTQRINRLDLAPRCQNQKKMSEILHSINRRRPVPTVRADSVQEFQEQFKLKGLPAVIPGVVADWPAIQRWSPDFFRDRFGDRQVTLDGQLHILADFLGNCHGTVQNGSTTPYLRQTKIRDLFPEELPQLQPTPPHWRSNWLDGSHVPSRLRTSTAHNYEILMGDAGTSFPTIHYDTLHLHAFVIQIFGRKKISLMAPHESSNLYPDPERPNKSTVPIDAAVADYPLLRNVTLYDAELAPGDAIFIPWGWWHAVINPELSIAVTLNLADRTNWKEYTTDWVSRQDFGPVKKVLAARILQVCGWLRASREQYGSR